MGVAGTFIDGGAGRILVVSYAPERPTDRCVLVVPAFAEEMNKSRRLVHDTGVALQRRGICTLVPDLYGTGDSEGDFADARWEIWIEDLRRTVGWARERGAARFGVLVVRYGMALLLAAAKHMDVVFERGVAWQPTMSGSTVLRHLLRMKVMAARMAGEAVPSADALRESLLNGTEPLEVGGYLLSPQLASAMLAAESASGPPTIVRHGLAIDFDASSASRSADGDAGDTGSAQWRTHSLAGERFWMATEPGPNPALIECTAAFLGEAA